MNGELLLNDHFNQPNHLMVHFLDQLVRGLATQNTLEVHMGFPSEVGFCNINRITQRYCFVFTPSMIIKRPNYIDCVTYYYIIICLYFL